MAAKSFKQGLDCLFNMLKYATCSVFHRLRQANFAYGGLILKTASKNTAHYESGKN
jgi:hypothetical protein